ncbi:MAG: UbiD family decarboxylase [Pirellulaceae bacterium]|jgi:4-hydroxy-3-polyprenylbenzoate decarboxylase|nr:UbiD family decarboxylase [Pirellulaceae bacterium]
MAYRSTRQLVNDLGRHQRLIIVDDPVDPHLELAEIHRRVYRQQGPALLFNNVIGTRFPVASNLFGTLERARFIFRDTLGGVKQAVRWKANPAAALRNPLKLFGAPRIAWRMQPKRVGRAAVMQHTCRLSELPQIVCWPDDGGPFVTLPQVLSQLSKESLSHINLGMYRVQLAGNDYVPEQECGLHYQIQRGIGVHHAHALALGQSLPVNVTIGGTPAMTVGAVMPLPEGMSELMFAGALAGHRIPLHLAAGAAPIYADADFCIVGEVIPGELKLEGPFGDHLGYYARAHNFPVMRVKRVYHRNGAVWPMTVVGRPPQEDTTFGELIHELTGPMIPAVLPGVRQVHAVDAAGVHPLLLAVGSERYTPYEKLERPQELLTQASAILGQGQLSLAKYLWIVDGGQSASLDARDLLAFFRFALERLDWRRDLHFVTRTTIDTLDYSGSGLNQGSKLILAAAGPVLRTLSHELDGSLRLPSGWSEPRIGMPGVLVVRGEPYSSPSSRQSFESMCDELPSDSWCNTYPLVVVCDDSAFTAQSIENFVWTTFTRSDPAIDVYGIGASQHDKHFGCTGSLVIDARTKPHHALGLMEDPATSLKVDARAARGGELAKYL